MEYFYPIIIHLGDPSGQRNQASRRVPVEAQVAEYHVMLTLNLIQGIRHLLVKKRTLKRVQGDVVLINTEHLRVLDHAARVW